jgi:hypothetical protein
MRKNFLVIVGIFIFSSYSFGESTYPLYNGKEYPVQATTLDKLKVLDSHLLDLCIDIDQTNLPNNWAVELCNGTYDHLKQILSLLIIEEIHSEEKQFNIRAISQISLNLIEIITFFKNLPDSCNKLMGLSSATPADVLYLGKVKDISREALDLLQEIKEQLSEFKN